MPAPEVRVRVGGRTLTLTNLDKPLYPDGFTKGEVIDYYARVAEVMLPHVRDRALTRLRYPAGVPADHVAPDTGGTTPIAPGSFYEKNAPVGTPDWVPRRGVRTSEGVIDYVVADEPATLVWLANLAALELHVPQWTLSSGRAGRDGVLDLPGEEAFDGEPLADRLVVDLDPGAGMTVLDSAKAAVLVAGVLAADGLVPVPQTSGSKGVQVYAALAPCRARDAWAYAKGLNVRMARERGDLFVATVSVQARRGRIYLDHNQDLPARNTIAPYSLRGRALPAVATPVTWEELAAATRPEDLRFSPADVLARVEAHGDLAADLLLDDRPPLPAPPTP